MNIRACEIKDIPSLCEIYNHYIEETVITFEEKAVTTEEMSRRVNSIQQSFPWLVCVRDNEVVGYAYASTWKERSAYRHTVEVTVYVKHSGVGKGVGKALYQALLELLKPADYHILLACIALPNEASVGLHEYFGFKKIAHFAEVGRKFNRWLDVGYWQKTNENL
ncbi:MAG TPA: arsinothricin resistance N-acetyltransferase ArsN1 family B [Cellvibrio sp.]|nr:arsinothricin resistance N-acetyltransferase ArsN1 family B [Cellvibrio sp.]